MKSTYLKRFLEGLHSVEFWITAAGLVLTNVLMFAQVLNRYWLKLPLVGIGDLTLYCFIMFMSVGAAVATWNETHVAVDALRDQFLHNKPLGLKAHHLAMAILAVLTFIFFLPQVSSFIASAVQFPKWATLVRWFNLSWLQMIWGFCMFLVFFHMIEMAVKHWLGFSSMRKAAREER